MKKKITVLSFFLAVFMVLAFGNVTAKAAGSGQDVVNYAKQFQGVPYSWGGTSPSGFDCSGFVQYVYRNSAGISLPRDTYGQIGVGTAVSQSNLQPGDLVFPSADHVGIYVGNGNMIHASSSRRQVIVSSVYGFYAGRRIINKPQSYITLSGGGYVNYRFPGYSETTGMNLIIRDYSSDVVRAFGWVDSDEKCSWSFDVTPPNSNYTRLYKGVNKVIPRRGSGYRFEPGTWYVMKVKGYNRNYQVVCENTVNYRIPNAIEGETAQPISSGAYTVVSSTEAREYPRAGTNVTRNLKAGETVDIYAEFKDWYLVARGTPQWVEKQYLRK